MSGLTEDRLEQIDRLWGLHAHRDSSKSVDGKCLAFVIDPRFATLPGHPSDLQFRLGASFGHNPFTPEMACGFVPPPVRPGEHVFGIHVIGTRGNAVTIFDVWYDACETSNGIDAINAAEQARALLAAIPDEEYLRGVTEGPEDDVSLQRSEPHDLDWFEIAKCEAF